MGTKKKGAMKMDYDRIVLGKVISRKRRECGMTQEVLSGLSGITRSQLSLIETGSTSVTLDTLWHIAEALSTPLSEMIREVEKH